MEFNLKTFRTIIFVRHGQYAKDPERLTALGKTQARLTARALTDLNPLKLFSSLHPRAIETAGILANEFGLVSTAHDFFGEALFPTLKAFESTMPKGHLKPGDRKRIARDMKVAQLRADLAHDFIFAPPKRGQDTYIVVAHGNVIRYWVTRALSIPAEKWLAMDVQQCSLTTVRVDKHGDKMLLGFADVGHIPLEKRTYI